MPFPFFCPREPIDLNPFYIQSDGSANEESQDEQDNPASHEAAREGWGIRIKTAGVWQLKLSLIWAPN